MTETDVRADQAEFLQRLKQHTKPYHVDVCGVDITVNPGVFPPTTDSRLLAKHIDIKEGNSVLDLTCGSGTFSVIAGLKGASCHANDVNNLAIENALLNTSIYNLELETSVGDLFDQVPIQSFDFIYSNGPYIEGDISDPLESAFFGAKNYVKSLFAGAHNYLSSTGIMLITFAEFGNISFFEATAGKSGFDFKVIDKASSSDGQRQYRLYQLNKASV